MFDATQGNQAIENQVETETNEFAALYMDLSPRKRLVIITKMNELLRDGTSIDAFATGTYAQNTAGQPAKALGSGSSGVSNDTGEAIRVILADTGLDGGFKHLIRRGYDQSAPDHIEVEADGTPKALRTTERQRDAERTAKETAVQQLADERDPNKNGSLAKQLADAQAVAAPADMIQKAPMKSALEDIKQHADDLKAPAGMKVTGKKELIDGINAAIASVS